MKWVVVVVDGRIEVQVQDLLTWKEQRAERTKESRAPRRWFVLVVRFNSPLQVRARFDGKGCGLMQVKCGVYLSGVTPFGGQVDARCRLKFPRRFQKKIMVWTVSTTRRSMMKLLIQIRNMENYG